MLNIVIFCIVFFCSGISIAAENLRKTPYSLHEQNEQADADELPRLEEKDLEVFKGSGWLVPLPDNNRTVIVDYRLSEKYRWCTHWTHRFLLDFGSKSKLFIGKAVLVTSAIRTVESQKSLIKINGNAAEAEGPKRSSHLTGATIDIAKKGLSKKQLDWIRNYLAELRKRGVIHVTEEFQQAVFHIMVFKNYEKIHLH